MMKGELCIVNETILRGLRLVIPKNLRERVLMLAHEGHPGQNRTKNRLRQKVWWPMLDKDVELLISRCYPCKLVNVDQRPEPLVRHEMPSASWKYICGDFFGPLPSGEMLFVIVDYFSRFVMTRIMKSTRAIDVIHVLGEIFASFGIPEKFMLDNGPPFNSKELKIYLGNSGVQIIHSTPYYPQQNGLVERENRNIKRALSISMNTNTDWRQALNEYLLLQHTTPHATTGVAPAELLFGRNLTDKLPGFVNNCNYQGEGAREEDAVRKEIGRLYTDKRRNAEKRSIEEGDTVLMKDQTKKTKYTSNYDRRCLEVVGRKGNEVWLKDKEDRMYKRNVSHVQRYDGIDPRLNEVPEESTDREEPEFEETQYPVEVLNDPDGANWNDQTHTHMDTDEHTDEEQPPNNLPELHGHEETPPPEIFVPNPALTSTQVRLSTRTGRTLRKPIYLKDYQV